LDYNPDDDMDDENSNMNVVNLMRFKGNITALVEASRMDDIEFYMITNTIIQRNAFSAMDEIEKVKYLLNSDNCPGKRPKVNVFAMATIKNLKKSLRDYLYQS